MATTAKVKGLEYIVDEKGRRKSVVMSCKAYRQLMEDCADLLVKSKREHETPEDIDAGSRARQTEN